MRQKSPSFASAFCGSPAMLSASRYARLYIPPAQVTMVINPTYLAQRTRTCMFHAATGPSMTCTLAKQYSATSWPDAQKRVVHAYRQWLRSVSEPRPPPLVQLLTYYLLQAPEVQTMYSLNMPVSKIRTKIRQEFERHRYVNKLSVVDMLLTQNHMEYQASSSSEEIWGSLSSRATAWRY